MGRLVSDKGCDLLLHALVVLQNEGLYPSVSIIGDGPERRSMTDLASAMGLSNQVNFLGAVLENRGRELSQHKIMAIPSRWSEPFGIVALEGIAAGCAIVASSQGGLAEAVGQCGLLFPNGDVPALAALLKKLLTDQDVLKELTAGSDTHLDRFDPGTVAQGYLELFSAICS